MRVVMSLPSYFRSLTFCTLISVGILAAYKLQLAESNAYLGYTELDITSYYVFNLILALFTTSILMPTRIQRPSDFFAPLYGTFVVLPYAALYPIRGEVPSSDFLLNFIIIAFPLLFVRLASSITPSVKIPKIFSHEKLTLIILLVSIGGLVLALSTSPSSAGFNLDASHDRRLEGREIYATGSLLAYLISMTANGFAPFLAFFAGWKKRYKLLVVAIACEVGFFYLLGLKAPILYVCLAWIFGVMSRNGTQVHFPSRFNLGIILIFIAFAIEFFLFGFSQIGDYLIRRAFSVPPYVVSAYFEFVQSSSFSNWSTLDGVKIHEPISFIIGESFLGQPGLNANTNTFIYQFAAGGLQMYALTSLLVASVYLAINISYRSHRNPALLYVAFAFSILITEQAVTTVLLSSGVAILIALTMFTGASNSSYRRKDHNGGILVSRFNRKTVTHINHHEL